ncbi:hypothetical protein PPSIR1_08871 [Plesiocystis pacifica SIR-1]|uniref:Uncharacterized protein n=1 Tax=Plesiocystis pacifica SIR-1 TaxID=391625 RepID=A6G703_9BACT|nr:hypothetical protein PPSIR1_08871 [Plesiocystis pacifica SIR-1]
MKSRGDRRDADAQQCAWTWAQGEVTARDERAPCEPRRVADPRFRRGQDAPEFIASPGAEPRPLPWPDIGVAEATLSADGRTIYVYGWAGDGEGVLRLVDADSLEVRQHHEFLDSVTRVLEGPGGELFVATHGERCILDASGRPRWTRAGGAGRVAWSPSGRLLADGDSACVELIDTHHAPDESASPLAGLPPMFDPDGQHFVVGRTLYDGHSGAVRAQLDPSFGRYLEGGPASPPWHVGTELIICNHSRLQLWRAVDGKWLPTDGQLRVPHWESIAYSRSGRHVVHGRHRRVRLRELPSLATLASLDLTVDVDALGLSPGGELVAAFGEGRVELRHRSGALLHTEPVLTSAEVDERSPDDFRLVFSADGRHLRLHIAAGEGLDWSLEGAERGHPFFQPAVNAAWRIDGDTVTRVPGPPPQDLQLPPGWTLEDGPSTVFRHADGATITLPCAGPWTSNPLDPRVLGSASGLFIFRGL